MDAPRSEEGLPDGTEMQAVRRAIFVLIFTQMSAKAGIKKHGQAAADALRKDFEQFRSMHVLEPLDAFKITEEQRAEPLRALSVIKEKRNGLLKGRTVADGSSQKGKYPKDHDRNRSRFGVLWNTLSARLSIYNQNRHGR